MKDTLYGPGIFSDVPTRSLFSTPCFKPEQLEANNVGCRVRRESMHGSLSVPCFKTISQARSPLDRERDTLVNGAFILDSDGTGLHLPCLPPAEEGRKPQSV